MSGMYVGARYSVASRARLHKIAKKLAAACDGTPVEPDDIHTTVVYSRIPEEPEVGSFPVYGSQWKVASAGFDYFGPNQDTLVMLLDCKSLAGLNQEFMDAGCTSNYPEYKPHITLAYGVKRKPKITAGNDSYFVDEVYVDPLNEDWAAKYKEESSESKEYCNPHPRYKGRSPIGLSQEEDGSLRVKTLRVVNAVKEGDTKRRTSQVPPGMPTNGDQVDAATDSPRIRRAGDTVAPKQPFAGKDANFRAEEEAAKGDGWFEAMTPAQQKEYIKEHPNSKYAKRSSPSKEKKVDEAPAPKPKPEAEKSERTLDQQIEDARNTYHDLYEKWRKLNASATRRVQALDKKGKFKESEAEWSKHLKDSAPAKKAMDDAQDALYALRRKQRD